MQIIQLVDHWKFWVEEEIGGEALSLTFECGALLALIFKFVEKLAAAKNALVFSSSVDVF